MEKGARTVLITGAATGIGLATTKELSQSGYRIFATAMPGQDVSELGRIPNVEILETDLTDEPSLNRLMERIKAEDRLDALISNAGIAVPGPIEGVPIEQLKRQYQVNVFAPMQLVQGLLPKLRESKGRLIFIGAGQGRVSLPFGGAYGSSKAALAAMTDSLRAEIHDSGITVSLVEPGAIKTGILESSKRNWAKVSESFPQPLLERYQSAMEKTFQTSERAFQNAMTPQEFAQILLTILESKNPKPRYLVGREARALAFIALLPARWKARLLLRMLD